MTTNLSLKRTRRHKQFDGFNEYYSHFSETCQNDMNFSIYLPPQAAKKNLPALYYLSGLTCSEEIFMTEAQAQGFAKKYELIVVVPDTSPRNTGIEGETNSYDLGTGASFYVDATHPKWSKHFRMDSYITQELRKLVEKEFPIDSTRRGIFGHSMGGHGALVLGLRNPELYQSISAFAPLCAPSRSPWGIKAFSEYLGSQQESWKKYDATELLISSQSKTPMLIDQGTEDEFLRTELFTDEFQKTAQMTDSPIQIRRQIGYDHSYFFVSTFMEDHFAFHANHLKNSKGN